MPDEILHPLRDLPLDEFGILGIGSFVNDYEVQGSHPEFKADYTDMSGPAGILVKSESGKTLLELCPPYTPDSTEEPGEKLIIKDKHRAGLNKPGRTLEFIVGKDAEVKRGGGIIQLSRAFLSHSSDIPLGITVIRGEGRIDDLIDGAFFNYIKTGNFDDPANLVIIDGGARTVIRGKAIPFSNSIYLNPNFPFRVGTVVIDSVDSPHLTKAAIDYYNNERNYGSKLTGIIAITPKMKHSYDKIENEVIPNGFITTFNPVDLVKYAFAGTSHPALGKEEKDITYADIFEAIKKVREQQGNNHQRIYVTLGEYGAIGVGSSGTIYRVDVFKTKEVNTNGAGDIFASVVTKYEHRRNLNQREYLSIYAVLAYASAAGSIHVSGLVPTLGTINATVRRYGRLPFENLGNIDLIDPKSPKLDRTLEDVNNKPVSGKYDSLIFQ